MGSDHAFEVFRKLPERQPEWVDACPSLESATERAREVASLYPGDYFVFDRENQQCVEAFPAPSARVSARVLLADDHEAIRKGVRQVLLANAHVEVVGEASNGREAIDEARKLQPDLIIMDWSMPELDGLTAAQMIKKFSPQTAILIFSVHTSNLFRDLAKNMGMEGFVTKGSSSVDLLSAVDAVLRKQTYFPA
jgi:CheY-like chemotaxis protein